MKQALYSVFDIKSKIYARPFVSINDEVAIRSFTGAVNSPDTDLNKYPHDYALVKLADWDDVTALIEPAKTPETISLAHEVWEKPQPIQMPEFNGEN